MSESTKRDSRPGTYAVVLAPRRTETVQIGRLGWLACVQNLVTGAHDDHGAANRNLWPASAQRRDLYVTDKVSLIMQDSGNRR